MSEPVSPDERRKLVWARVYLQLLHYAVPDSRFNLDFLSFTPDFRNSSAAIEHVADLLCYKSAKTVLVTSDNSLEQLRYRALRDGKKLLVATYRLRRGFVLLDPARISEDRYELAACLDGMEKSGHCQSITLAKLRDDGLSVDMCVTGALAISEQGIVIWEGHALFEVQWALLHDIGVLSAQAPVVAVAHMCQVVAEAQLEIDPFKPDKAGEVQCDFVVTPEKVLAVDDALKPVGGIDFDKVDPQALNNIPPLQELKGIRMMEQIMRSSGFGTNVKEDPKPQPPSAEEQMGIDIIENLMKGYKT
ncbi:hypothetical protein ACN47E_000256 [Coniothyrium glycines]